MLPLLSIQNLQIQFTNENEKTFAVDDISFDINKGELLAIVGESGSGKSVTALSLLHLLPKQTQIKGKALFSINNAQTIDLYNAPFKTLQAFRGKDIAMIFQEPMTSLNPVYTCGQQVIEVIQLHKKINKAAAKLQTIELFKKVKLPDAENIINRYPHQLSGGQKQRVMIAMSISCNPSLLIADEPTTALDVTVQKTILSLIKDLQIESNMSVILITHDLGIVADIADKIAVMYQGKIVEQGFTKDILNNPKNNYTKALLACRSTNKKKGEPLVTINNFLAQSLANQTSPNNKKIPPENKEQNLALQVQHLKVYFPIKNTIFSKSTNYFKAVDDVSFNVMQGETLGLVGESGCGKTTLGRCILQLIKPTSGKIFLGENDISQIKGKALQQIRKDLQIVFQDPYGSLNPRITIGNAIAEPLLVHGISNNFNQRKEIVIDLLEKVNLNPNHFNRYPHQFSGGQRQRICIARALALNPSFLIFDESVSALDVSVQAQVLNLLNDLKKEFKFSSIFISHDLSVVRYISDRILVMHNGKIVEEGEAEQIYRNPKNTYTQSLIAAIPGIDTISN